MHPNLGDDMGLVWHNVHAGLVLPSWHCAFKGCTAAAATTKSQGSHERELWLHVWTTVEHKKLITGIIKKFELNEKHLEVPEIAFTLYCQSLAESERNACPKLGLSTDRRALGHLAEVLRGQSGDSDVLYLLLQAHPPQRL